MEFRTFADGGALGVNAFDVSIASPSSPRPNFRAFSAGGVNSSGVVTIVNPDLANVATGGYSPTSIPPGQATPGVENTFYLGEAQLVTRVSRMHSIWFATGGATSFIAQSLVPSLDLQPAGTSVTLGYRGATNVTGPARNNAATLDVYGEDAAS